MSEPKTIRGAAMVRDVCAEEHLRMQRRIYRRVRPYLVGAMERLRRAYPAFQTVVFGDHKGTPAFVLLFGDGTQTREAPKTFRGLVSACEDLARLSEIERLTAGDALWQVRQGGSPLAPSTIVIQQHRYLENGDAWQFWQRRPLRDARYYVREDMFSRAFYGAQRAGFGKRIVTEAGVVVDEWVDPVEAMILRALREKDAPFSLGPLCRAMAEIANYPGRIPNDDGCFYFWDVLKACENLARKGTVRRINPRADEGAARFVLCARGSA